MDLSLLIITAAVALAVGQWFFLKERKQGSRQDQRVREAGERIAFALGGQLIDAGGPIVHANVNQRRVVCEVHPSLATTIRVETREPLPPAVVAAYRVGGKSLADFDGRTLISATPDGIMTHREDGPSAELVTSLLPTDIYARLVDIGANYLTMGGAQLIFTGRDAPTGDEEIEAFRAAVAHSVLLADRVGRHS